MRIACDIAIPVVALIYLEFALFQGRESPVVSVALILAAAARMATARRGPC